MLPESVFGGAFLFGIVIALWARIKTLLWRVTNLLVVQVAVDRQAETVMRAYLWGVGRRSRFGEKRYSGSDYYVRPLGRRLVVLFEGIGTDATVFWFGRRPLVAYTDNRPTTPGSPHHTPVLTLTYVRWTFGEETLLRDATAWYNARYHGKTRPDRYQVTRVVGRGKLTRSGDAFERGDQSAAALAVDPSGSLTAFGGSCRFLGWREEDLGEPIPADPFEFLAYPPEGLAVRDAVAWWLDNEGEYRSRGVPWRMGVALTGPPGTGKCLARGTPVMRADGTVVAVEAVAAGDLLMGPDGRPRRVLGLASGRSPLYRVTQAVGAPYVVNAAHVLSLRATRRVGGYGPGDVVDVGVTDYLAAGPEFRAGMGGWRVDPRAGLASARTHAVGVTPAGVGDYFGFELTGDGLFLLGDGTVTHNTSLVRAIAQRFGLALYVIELATMTDPELIAAWQRARNNTPAVVLIEDVDTVFHGRTVVEGGPDGLSFGCLLNCLSGAEGADGVLVFVTTNRPETLDPALGAPDPVTGRSTRPGRIDYVVTLGPLDEAARVRVAGKILAGFPAAAAAAVAAGVGYTGAQFQQLCVERAFGLIRQSQTASGPPPG